MLVRTARSSYFQGIHCLAPLIPLFIYLSIPVDLNLQPLGKGIYNGGAYAVKPAGNLISAASEFASCMKDRKYYLHSRDTRFFLYIYRDSPSVIDNGDGIVLIDGNVNGAAVSRKGFIYCVIYDLINQMMKASGRGAADIHTGTLSHCLKSFQDLDLICSVLLLCHVLYLPFFSGNFLCVSILAVYLSVHYFEDFVNREPVINKILQPGTGDHGLNILYGGQKLGLAAAVQFRENIIQKKDGSILTYQLYKLQFGQLQRKGGGTLLALGAKPSDIDTIYNKIDIIPVRTCQSSLLSDILGTVL